MQVSDRINQGRAVCPAKAAQVLAQADSQLSIAELAEVLGLSADEVIGVLMLDRASQ